MEQSTPRPEPETSYRADLKAAQLPLGRNPKIIAAVAGDINKKPCNKGQAYVKTNRGGGGCDMMHTHDRDVELGGESISCRPADDARMVRGRVAKLRM